MLTIYANPRLEKGTSFSRKLRISNRFPGILYGGKKPSILLELDHDIVFNLQKKIEFYKNNLYLLIEGKTHTVKVKSVQRHSFKLKLLHIDFFRV